MFSRKQQVQGNPTNMQENTKLSRLFELSTAGMVVHFHEQFEDISTLSAPASVIMRRNFPTQYAQLVERSQRSKEQVA